MAAMTARWLVVLFTAAALVATPHGGMDDQVHPDHTLRLADRLIAADKDFELLMVPGAEHTFIDCLAYVRKRCWDFLVRELMGTQPPAYRPATIAIDPELLGELFA